MRGQKIARKSKVVALKLDRALVSAADSRAYRHAVAKALDVDLTDVTRADVLREAVRRGMGEIRAISGETTP
jgi:hypothetical protein